MNKPAVILLCMLLALPTSAKTLITRGIDNEQDKLIMSVLKLALQKAGNNHKAIPDSEVLPNSRQISEVNLGNLDVVWAGSSQSYDNSLKAVRIPIFKGMRGYRVFIIKPENQYKFDQIENLSDLKSVYAGQGKTWGSTKVLKNAGIPTITTVRSANLLPMLEGERFDYYPVGMNEPWAKMATRPDLNLTVEKNILLVYPFAIYFYVAKSNTKLQNEIYQGLEVAIADGSYDELVFNSKYMKNLFAKVDVKNRKVIKIENPYLHKDTPFNRNDFWFDINKM